jgi:hypothetical protein
MGTSGGELVTNMNKSTNIEQMYILFQAMTRRSYFLFLKNPGDNKSYDKTDTGAV